VGVDDYRQIAADLFALEEDPSEARNFVRDGLATLSRLLRPGSDDPLVMRYEVAGRRYIYITKWDKHQKVDRPGRTRFPRPPEGLTCENGTSNDSPVTVSRHSRDDLAPGTGEQGNRGTGDTSASG